MTQERKTERADASQDSEKFAESGKPEVLSRLERLHAELAKETGDAPSTGGDIRDEFTKQALTRFAELIAEIATNDALPRQERLQAIYRARDLATEEAEKLEPKIPEKAPALWNDRKDPDANPFVWAYETYGAAAEIMVVSDFARLDRPLGNRLDKERRDGKPIPEGYYIQSKAERDKALLDAPLTWSQLMAELPSSLQRKFRAFKAAEGRKHRAP